MVAAGLSKRHNGMDEVSSAGELSLLMTMLALAASSKLFLAGLPIMIIADVVDELIHS